jgi:hypothetical protein
MIQTFKSSVIFSEIRQVFRRPSYAFVGLMMLLSVSLALVTGQSTATAGTGGRFTFQRENGSGTYWGESFYGAGLGEIPFAIDTNGDVRQELAVYYNGRITIRNDNGTYRGFNFAGGGSGEVPLAINLTGKGSRVQQFAVYYQGRFTWLNSNGTYSGVTLPGAGRMDIPLVVDTDGNGVQEFAVYRNGRFTFLRANGSIWSVDFAGATANDIPFAIDTNNDGKQELAVYRNGRMTVRNDNGTYWGFNFQGAGYDDMPLAIDTNGNGRQEFAIYNHVSNQLSAKQILGMQNSGRIKISDNSDNKTRDKADRSLASLQLQDIADGGGARLSTRCSYASHLSPAIAPDPTFMRFLVEYGERGYYNISALFGQCHSGTKSAHHEGKAVDIVCDTVTGHGDAAGQKYGVKRNFETCAVHKHWHYSVGGI